MVAFFLLFCLSLVVGIFLLLLSLVIGKLPKPKSKTRVICWLVFAAIIVAWRMNR